uniref:Zinc finger protein 658 n=1 Tax=Cacopsylla melanoneura TaxID=428564 RepID=A0A8D9BM02_9HEMI
MKTERDDTAEDKPCEKSVKEEPIDKRADNVVDNLNARDALAIKEANANDETEKRGVFQPVNIKEEKEFIDDSNNTAEEDRDNTEYEREERVIQYTKTLERTENEGKIIIQNTKAHEKTENEGKKVIQYTKTQERTENERKRIVQNIKRLERNATMQYWQCKKCPKTYSNQVSLRRHNQTHKGRQYTCAQCSQSFSRRDALQRHLPTHHDNTKRPQCDICLKYFAHISYLRKHEKLHLEEKYTCHHCQKSFLMKLYLQRHMLLHGDPMYSCSKCSKTFHQKGALNRHSHLHQGIRYPCNQCTRTFTQRVCLKNHQHARHEGKRFLCNQCGKCFCRKDYWIVHRRSHKTGPQQDQHNQCTQSNYIRIQFRSHKHQNYQCTECPKAFSSSCTVNDHLRSLRTHQGLFYSCQTCSKLFSHKSSLANHLHYVCLSSTTETAAGLNDNRVRFSCIRCSKSFLYKQSLRDHLHHNVCLKLNNEFAENSTKGNHDLSDSTIRFSCNRCSKSFPYKKSLRNHLRNNVCLKNVSSEKLVKNRARKNKMCDSVSVKSLFFES